MRKGQTMEMTIETVAFGGDGVGRVDGQVVFVPFTVTGDRVAVTLVSVAKRYARGQVIRILAPSPYRILPRCPYFAMCGGCQYQHVLYEHQLQIKEEQVRDILIRIGRFEDPPLLSIIPSPLIFGYRGKAEFQVHRHGRDMSAGFMDTTGRAVVDVVHCDLLDESINGTLAHWRADYPGFLKNPRQERLLVWSEERGDGDQGNDEDLPPGCVLRWAQGLPFIVPRDGFFQANGALLGELVAEVIRMSDPKGDETILDAYSGSGLFSRFLAPRAGRVFGIEAAPEAVSCAQENLRRADIVNAEFYLGDTGDVLRREFLARSRPVTVVVLDPPRGGCEREVLESLLIMKPRRLVYISCHPATQARDLKFLADGGYFLKAVRPLDMFPQTQHVEVIALLDRRPEGGERA